MNPHDDLDQLQLLKQDCKEREEANKCPISIFDAADSFSLWYHANMLVARCKACAQTKVN